MNLINGNMSIQNPWTSFFLFSNLPLKMEKNQKEDKDERKPIPLFPLSSRHLLLFHHTRQKPALKHILLSLFKRAVAILTFPSTKIFFFDHQLQRFTFSARLSPPLLWPTPIFSFCMAFYSHIVGGLSGCMEIWRDVGCGLLEQKAVGVACRWGVF